MRMENGANGDGHSDWDETLWTIVNLVNNSEPCEQWWTLWTMVDPMKSTWFGTEPCGQVSHTVSSTELSFFMGIGGSISPKFGLQIIRIIHCKITMRMIIHTRSWPGTPHMGDNSSNSPPLPDNSPIIISSYMTISSHHPIWPYHHTQTQSSHQIQAPSTHHCTNHQSCDHITNHQAPGTSWPCQEGTPHCRRSLAPDQPSLQARPPVLDHQQYVS